MRTYSKTPRIMGLPKLLEDSIAELPLSLKEVAAEIGVSTVSLWYWRTGKKSPQGTRFAALVAWFDRKGIKFRLDPRTLVS